MSRPFIIIGDKTDHGSTVIHGAAATATDSKPIARVGDRLTRTRTGHGRTTVFSTGDPARTSTARRPHAMPTRPRAAPTRRRRRS